MKGVALVNVLCLVLSCLLLTVEVKGQFNDDCANNKIQNPSFSQTSANPAACPGLNCCVGPACSTGIERNTTINSWRVVQGAVSIFVNSTGGNTTISSPFSISLAYPGLAPGQISQQFVTRGDETTCTLSWYDTSRLRSAGVCDTRDYQIQIFQVNGNEQTLISSPGQYVAEVGPTITRRYVSFGTPANRTFIVYYQTPNANIRPCGPFIDDVCISCGPNPTPSFSPSRTTPSSLAPTISASRSFSSTSTTSLSSTSTASRSSTSTASRSSTSTASRSSTSTASLSSTSTASLSATSSPSFSSTSTASLSSTSTASLSSTSTASLSSTSTASLSSTSTASLSSTSTASLSSTSTASLSSTSTASLSSTSTASLSSTSTASLSSTSTASLSATSTASLSSTTTASLSATSTASLTNTATATSTSTATASRSLTSTASATASISRSTTASLSTSGTRTTTASRTSTASRTNTASLSRSPSTSTTASLSPSLSESRSSTSTASQTSSVSLTRSLSPSASMSPAPFCVNFNNETVVRADAYLRQSRCNVNPQDNRNFTRAPFTNQSTSAPALRQCAEGSRSCFGRVSYILSCKGSNCNGQRDFTAATVDVQCSGPAIVTCNTGVIGSGSRTPSKSPAPSVFRSRTRTATQTPTPSFSSSSSPTVVP
eukprot:TRINITY_DN543_c0_g1_i5.p1 TRINITY_DN543_c0_g1~~TRINITY_DN543_c0_g1_i5.p1  ORF type:complete len:662 (+),score=117.81 TRINITY_DN543_c0_g1_i5:42-2027(+)